MTFRHDINGLRGWAVAVVVLYHFGIPGFAGGFVGVDAFFVVSGYLMASIVGRGLDEGRFKLVSFYLARARRIVPALAVLCLGLLTAGWFWLDSVEYAALAQQSLASLLFGSNVLFYSQSGYFDASAYDKWLLHTWSLGIEGQYYLLFPLLLLALWRWLPQPRHRLRALVGIAAVSLGACILISPWEPARAFFLLPTRAWELLAGALVYLLPNRPRLSEHACRGLDRLGFALLLIAAIGLHGSLSWPGYWALVPVLGTVAILIARRSDSLLSGNRLSQWLGSRSYSIYLWHWPVVIALHYLQVQHAAPAIMIGIVVSLALGHASWRWVENPPRVWLQRASGARQGLLLGCAIFAISAQAVAVVRQDGFPTRMPEQVLIAARESQNRLRSPVSCDDDASNPGRACRYGSDRIDAIIIGDSHAESVITALLAANPSREGGVLAWTYPSCLLLTGLRMTPGVLRSGRQCPRFNEWVQESLTRLPPEIAVVLVSRTTAYIDGFTEHQPGIQTSKPGIHFSGIPTHLTPEFIREFSDHMIATACKLAEQRPVFLVKPIPEMPVDVPKTVARSLVLGQFRFPSVDLSDYQTRNRVVLDALERAKAECGVRLLDPTVDLCPNGRCKSTEGSRPIYYDDDHLSEFGNKLLVPMFSAVYEKVGEPENGLKAAYRVDEPATGPAGDNFD